MTITYSERFRDGRYEYRHVTLPATLAAGIEDTSSPLLEHEWRSLGVQQSHGWKHAFFFKNDPRILVFRRPLPSDAAARSARRGEH